MMKRNFFLICALIFHVCLHASTDEVDEFVNRYMKKKQIPGLAVLVKKNGEIVRSKGYGFANLEHMIEVKPQTVFQSGSIGKQFTATAVMMLVENGKLQLTDPISKYLTVPKSWKSITIVHLLTHTSGLGDYPEDFSLQKDYSEEEIMKMVTKQPLAFKPGEKWNYSNLAYVTLGVLIRKVSGKFYGDFLQERVFGPLGMKSTRIINEADIISNRAAGYRLMNGKFKNQEWVSPSLNTTADGSLYFTIEDLAKWDAALESEDPLKRDSLEKMWTPVVLNDGKKEDYGFGWGLYKTKNGNRLVEHGGAWQGFTSHIARYLEDRVTVAVLCNVAGGDATYIAHRIAGLYNPDLGPPQHVAIQVGAEVLRSYEGQYRLEDRLTLKVTSEGDKLITEFAGQKLELIPESETMFFEEDSERTFEFIKDQSGKPTAMILRLPMELKFSRIQ